MRSSEVEAETEQRPDDSCPVEELLRRDRVGPSRNTMSGAYYDLSARLTLDGETMTGHALRGTAMEAHREN